LYSDADGVPTSGLNPLAVKEGDPPLPAARSDYPRLSVDPEGLVLNKDGTVWVSDEYGPYVYLFEMGGKLKKAIAPPDAILPHDDTGALNFTADEDPTTGRAPNQGFEGLSYDHSTKTLYALLQSATWQDGGDNRTHNRYTRLVAYDLSDHRKDIPVVGEWVVPLPQTAQLTTLATSELFFVKKNVFLSLARDGLGRGGDETESEYKGADLFDITDATDIHGTKYDDPANPIATEGVLNSDITPATYMSFVNYLDSTQLARFGLHNGDPDDHTLITAKWESFALAPVGDKGNPDDYFLFTGADNDFISTKGISLGMPFNASVDSDNQFLVFRVTLPGAKIEI